MIMEIDGNDLNCDEFEKLRLEKSIMVLQLFSFEIIDCE